MKTSFLLAVLFASFTIIGCKPILNDSPFCDSTTRPTNLKFDQSEYFAVNAMGATYYSIKFDRYGLAEFKTFDESSDRLLKRFPVEVKFCKSGKTEYSYMDIAFKDVGGKKLYFSILIVPVKIKDKSGKVANLYSTLALYVNAKDLSNFNLKFPEVNFRSASESPTTYGHFTVRNASPRYISYIRKLYDEGYAIEKLPSGFIKEGLVLVSKNDIEFYFEFDKSKQD